MQDRSPNSIIGPDINEWRGEVDYALLATRTPYCYVRASGSGTGRFRVDRLFFEYVRGLRSVGIISGAYHYAVPSYDLTTADSQCDDFIRILEEAYGPGRYGDMFPVVDIEYPLDKSISTDALLDWVDRFRRRFERKTRRILMLYTGSFFIDLYNNFYHSTKGFILSDMPLWIAMYPEIQGNPPYPPDGGGWTRWTLWQFAENGIIPGVNPPVDLNYGPTNLDYLTPPRDVRNLKAYGSDGNIYLSWDRNTDVDLNGYNIFLDSEYVGTVGRNATSHTIRLWYPNKNARYEVGIEAFDVTGDFSQNRTKTIVMLRHAYDEIEDNHSDERQEKDKDSEEHKEEYGNYKKDIEVENYDKKHAEYKEDVNPKEYSKDCNCYKKHMEFNYDKKQNSYRKNIMPISYQEGHSDYKKDIKSDNCNRAYNYYRNYMDVKDFHKEDMRLGNSSKCYDNYYQDVENDDSYSIGCNKLDEVYEDNQYCKYEKTHDNLYRSKYEIYYDEDDELYYYPVKVVDPQGYMERRDENKREYSPLFKYTLEEEKNEFDDFEYEQDADIQVSNIITGEVNDFGYERESNVQASNMITDKVDDFQYKWEPNIQVSNITADDFYDFEYEVEPNIQVSNRTRNDFYDFEYGVNPSIQVSNITANEFDDFQYRWEPRIQTSNIIANNFYDFGYEIWPNIQVSNMITNEFDDFGYRWEPSIQTSNIITNEFDEFEYKREPNIQVSNITTMDYGEEFEFARGYYDDDFENYEIDNYRDEEFYDNYTREHIIQYSKKNNEEILEDNIPDNYVDKKIQEEDITENRINLYALNNYSEEDYTEYERHIDEEYNCDTEYESENEIENDTKNEEEYKIEEERTENEEKYKIEENEDEYRGEEKPIENEEEYKIEECTENEEKCIENKDENKKREEDTENKDETEIGEKYRESKSGDVIEYCEENLDGHKAEPSVENESKDEEEYCAKNESNDDIGRNSRKEYRDSKDEYRYEYLKEDKKMSEDWDGIHYRHWYENNHNKANDKKKNKKHHKKHKR